MPRDCHEWVMTLSSCAMFVFCANNVYKCLLDTCGHEWDMPVPRRRIRSIALYHCVEHEMPCNMTYCMVLAVQAISLTEQALQQQEAAGRPAQCTAGPSTDAEDHHPELGRKRKSRFDAGPEGAAANGALPQQVVDQIKSAKARSALDGRAPPGWAIGHNCLARGISGQWEAGKVAAVSPAGGFLIEFDSQPGVPVEVHRADAKPRDFKVTTAYCVIIGLHTHMCCKSFRQGWPVCPRWTRRHCCFCARGS